MCRRLAKEEGVFCGGSTGLKVAGAVEREEPVVLSLAAEKQVRPGVFDEFSVSPKIFLVWDDEPQYVGRLVGVGGVWIWGRSLAFARGTAPRQWSPCS